LSNISFVFVDFTISLPSRIKPLFYGYGKVRALFRWRGTRKQVFSLTEPRRLLDFGLMFRLVWELLVMMRFPGVGIHTGRFGCRRGNSAHFAI
jgi:hypothetical protein